MKWLIKNPAPTDSRQSKWGDFHFGRSLTKYLRRLGDDVESHYHPNWSATSDADIVLILRGKYPYKLQSKGDPLHVMWNISHPGSVSFEEYNEYDLVFVASNSHAEFLQRSISTPAMPLLQCTDLEEFYPDRAETEGKREGVVFAGNTREVNRPSVHWAIDYGLALRIWGRGWDALVPEDYIVSEYIENAQLGQLYNHSLATLNDHWPDMKKHGFINNRIYDALAVGLPIISDYHEALYRMFPKAILYYRNREEFERCVEELLLNYHAVSKRAANCSSIIQQDFSFESRAKELRSRVLAQLKL